MNEFELLCKNLHDGKLNLTHIAIALSDYYRTSDKVPEELQSIIGGIGEGSGLVHRHFRLLSNAIGDLELAYLRTKHSKTGN